MPVVNSKPHSRRLQSAKPKAGQVDTVVGTRLRLRRRMLDMSQQELADALDIAQQQLQKYETGQNRISASRLYEAAKLLKAPIAWFYEGLDDPADEESLQMVLGLDDGETRL